MLSEVPSSGSERSHLEPLCDRWVSRRTQTAADAGHFQEVVKPGTQRNNRQRCRHPETCDRPARVNACLESPSSNVMLLSRWCALSANTNSSPLDATHGRKPRARELAGSRAGTSQTHVFPSLALPSAFTTMPGPPVCHVCGGKMADVSSSLTATSWKGRMSSSAGIVEKNRTRPREIA